VWTGLAGVGTGMALIGAQNAALATLDKPRAGAGSAAVQAMRQVGSVTGIAALGALVNGVYRSDLHLTGAPDQVAGAVRASVASGVAVGARLRAPALVHSVQQAFTSGMDAVLWTSAGVCVLAAVLMWLFLPNTPFEITSARQSQRAAADVSAPTD
jgi:MFS transporter, DHA2 family, multidrug resistance protein